MDVKVLIIGAGGLGSPVALYLAAAGTGTIGIADADVVDLSNLQRQVIHLVRVAQAVAKKFPLKEKEALVLMGHGAEHYADTAYAALDHRFKDMGFSNVYMGMVEGDPTLESVLRRMERAKPEKVILAPLMIVAGDHARNDLAGDGEDSWKTRFMQEGYQVECALEGLGEYDEVRRVLLDHIDASAKKLGESGTSLRR